MASRDELEAWRESLVRKSYYEILDVSRVATSDVIKSQFHEFALRFHPDRFVNDDPDAAPVAAEVFKRGVEAYRVLSNGEQRKKYDEALSRGILRFDERRVAPEKPAIVQRTLEMIATTSKGKTYAMRAERLIAIGKLDDARVQLINACQQEPANEELAERLQLIYEVLALEPF